MQAVPPALLGALAPRGPALAPVPPLDVLFLPPPIPPAQGLPPADGKLPAVNGAAAGGDISIQTIDIDNPAGASPSGANDIIEVTMTQPAAAAATETGAGSAAPIQPTAPTSPAEPTPPAKPTPPEHPHGGPPGGPPGGRPQTEGGKDGPHKEPTTGDCSLMGPFAIFVQLGLGGLALMSLVFKRWRERPQRPVKIWFFDVSKQVFGSVLVHMANVFMSLLTSGRFNMSFVAQDMGTAEEPYVPNPCSFYLLNLAIDTTLGIPILIFLLHITTAAVSYTPLGRPLESIQSGNYGRPPNAWWWLKQSIIYFCGLFGMKLCVLIIFLTMPWISRVGDWALSWTDGNEEVQIVFVMMLFPLIMNAMQYYIIDSFIKAESSSALPEAGRRTGVYDQLADSADDEGSDDGDSDDDTYMDGSTGNLNDGGESGRQLQRRTAEVTARKRADSLMAAPSATGKKGVRTMITPASGPGSDPEYDPEIDGDSPTIIGSGSSQRSRHNSRQATPAVGSILKEMYPAE